MSAESILGLKLVVCEDMPDDEFAFLHADGRMDRFRLARSEWRKEGKEWHDRWHPHTWRLRCVGSRKRRIE